MSTTRSPSGDSLQDSRDALGDAGDALRRSGAQESDPQYADVFKALRRADQLIADAMRRRDAGQPISQEEFDEILQIFDAIRPRVL